eukprot:SAG31_NODE_2408_length_5758_cov_10.495847_3_plen_51_part_00
MCSFQSLASATTLLRFELDERLTRGREKRHAVAFGGDAKQMMASTIARKI